MPVVFQRLMFDLSASISMSSLAVNGVVIGSKTPERLIGMRRDYNAGHRAQSGCDTLSPHL